MLSYRRDYSGVVSVIKCESSQSATLEVAAESVWQVYCLLRVSKSYLANSLPTDRQKRAIYAQQWWPDRLKALNVNWGAIHTYMRLHIARI